MKHFLFFITIFCCLQIQGQIRIVNPDGSNSAKIEVAGTVTDFSYSKVYLYNPTRKDSHIYMGYYYTASQLDSIFGGRTMTQVFEEGDAIYRYDHHGIQFSMTPANDMGLFSFMIVGNNYKCSIEGVEMQVGDNINRINWSAFNKFREKTLEDGTIRIWYRTPSSDLLVVKHKNNIITGIRFDLDF